MRLESADTVQILHLDETENRFSPDWVAEFTSLLDAVEALPHPVALVTIGSGRFWSNGLDVEWMRAHPGDTAALVDAVHALYARLLSSPVPTVAAIQGHAYAAGGLLALAHGSRIMREDRGFFCLPEVDIAIPFTGGMTALVQAKVAPPVLHRVMAHGRRYGGEDALAAGLVDAIASEVDLLPGAIAYAGELAGKDRSTLTAISRALYAPALAALAEPAPAIELPAPR